MTGRITELKDLLEPVVLALGYRLWGIEYRAQGKYSTLRVFIDKDGGIDVEDCADASRQISSLLDVEDPISGEYTLEVSSPGLDRSLFEPEQYAEYAGHYVRLRLTQGFEGKRNFSGQIKAVTDDEVILIVGDEEYGLPFALIEKANIVPQII